jgi:hypothetical protein
MRFGQYGSILVAATLAPESSLDMVRFLIEEARVDLAELTWQPPPTAQHWAFRRIPPSPSKVWLKSEQTRARERAVERERSRAEREKHLIDEQGVHPQVLKDIQL